MAAIPSDVGTLDKYGAQERFLASVKERQVPISVFLIDGVRLTGTLESFDAFSLVLKEPAKPKGRQQLVYKKFVATITPTQKARNVLRGGDRRS